MWRVNRQGECVKSQRIWKIGISIKGALRGEERRKWWRAMYRAEPDARWPRLITCLIHHRMQDYVHDGRQASQRAEGSNTNGIITRVSRTVVGHGNAERGSSCVEGCRAQYVGRQVLLTVAVIRVRGSHGGADVGRGPARSRYETGGIIWMQVGVLGLLLLMSLIGGHAVSAGGHGNILIRHGDILYQSWQ